MLLTITVNNGIPSLKQTYFKQMWVRASCPQAAQSLWLCRKVRGEASLNMHMLPGHHFPVSLQAWLAHSAFTSPIQRAHAGPLDACMNSSLKPWNPSLAQHLCSRLCHQPMVLCSPQALTSGAPFPYGVAAMRSHCDERRRCCSKTWQLLIISGSLGR